LKLPSTGYRSYSDGSLVNQGSLGIMWSSSVTVSDSYYLSFSSGNASTRNDYRTDGLSVRCLRN
jgi:hypothetical protein